MPVINGVIVLESRDSFEFGLPVITRDDCPPNSIYFMPSGSTAYDPSTGKTTELIPGVYVNPKQLAVITNVK